MVRVQASLGSSMANKMVIIILVIKMKHISTSFEVHIDFQNAHIFMRTLPEIIALKYILFT